MFAVEFESSDIVQKIVEKLLKKGIISFWFLSCPDSFRLAPPLNISLDEIKSGGQLIKEVIEEVVS